MAKQYFNRNKIRRSGTPPSLDGTQFLEGSQPAHTPVLLVPFLEHGFPPEGKIFVDGTFGFGGHSNALLKRFPSIEKIYAFDRDADVLKISPKIPHDPRITCIHSRFSKMADILKNQCSGMVDGLLLDLGVSSWQISEPGRGFSFQSDGPLDMRMDKSETTTAADLVNSLPEKELSDIFFKFGEERFSRRIARAILGRRSTGKFSSTADLASFVASLVPRQKKGKTHIHPATRVFQALRIAVNEELLELRETLENFLPLMAPGGRISVISFHSLEDRIVKNFFSAQAKGCICPPLVPQCRCGKAPALRLIFRKPVIADLKEISENPRSRSAKLRVAERLPSRDGDVLAGFP